MRHRHSDGWPTVYAEATAKMGLLGLARQAAARRRYQLDRSERTHLCHHGLPADPGIRLSVDLRGRKTPMRPALSLLSTRCSTPTSPRRAARSCSPYTPARRPWQRPHSHDSATQDHPESRPRRPYRRPNAGTTATPVNLAKPTAPQTQISRAVLTGLNVSSYLVPSCGCAVWNVFINGVRPVSATKTRLMRQPWTGAGSGSKVDLTGCNG
jgi:hypothetical protein